MSKFEMLTSLAKRSVNKVEHTVVGPGTVAPKAGYKDSWIVGGLHPHTATRRNFSIRTGVKVAAAAGVASAASIAMASAAEAKSRKSKKGRAHLEAPAAERRLIEANGRPTSGSPDAAPEPFKSSGDTVLDGYQRSVDSLTKAVNEEASRGGFGDKSEKASKALAGAQQRLADYKKQKAADDRAAAQQATADADAAAKRKKAADDDAYAKSSTGMAVGVAKEYGGYALGAIAGIALGKTLTKKLAKGAAEKVARFEHVAGEVAKLNASTTGKNIVGSSKGDHMASLLKEAFRTAGVKADAKLPGIDPLSMKAAQATIAGTKASANRAKSIAVGDLLHKDSIIAKSAEHMKAEKTAGMTVKAIDAEAKSASVAVEADRHFADEVAAHADAADAKMFKESHRLDHAIAAGLLVEGVSTRVAGAYSTDENQKTLLTNIGTTSIAAAALFHSTRAIAHANPGVKASVKSVVAVTSARDRIAREVMRAGRNTGHAVEADIERLKVTTPAAAKSKLVADTVVQTKAKKEAAAKVAKSEADAARKQAEALFAKKPAAAAPKPVADKAAKAMPTGHVDAPTGTAPKGKFSGFFR